MLIILQFLKKTEHHAIQKSNCCKVCFCFADTPGYQQAPGYGQPPSYPGHQPPVYYPPPVPPQTVAGYMNPAMQPQQWHNNSNNNDSHNSNSHSENRAISNNVTIVQGPQQQAASTPTISELFFLFPSRLLLESIKTGRISQICCWANPNLDTPTYQASQ